MRVMRTLVIVSGSTQRRSNEKENTSMAFLAVLLSAFAVTSPQVTLTAPGHTPKINTHWNYVVRVSDGGKPVSARITATIVDPIGGAHPVEFGKSTKTITNWPFKGVFKDFIVWPASSRGVPLKFRIVVRVGSLRKTIAYTVTAHA
jgi:hypothetical protein